MAALATESAETGPKPVAEQACAGSPGEKEETSAYAKTHHDSYRIISKAVRREQGEGRELRDGAWTSWMTSPHVWYRHPLLRMMVPWIITLLDLYMYVEDPLNDAHVDYNVPMQGHALGLLAFWAAPTAGLKVLRLGLTLISWIFAGVVGRQFIVGVVFKRWIKLSAFQGSEPLLCVVFLLAGCFMFGGALFYNVVAPDDQLDGTSNDIFLIFGARTEQYRHVNQCWQSLSLLVDVLTILTVTDICLQDQIRYPRFLPSVKELWTRKYGGWVRIVVAWVIFVSCGIVIVWGVFSTGPEEGQIRAPVILGGSDETVRNIGAGALVFVDLLVTCQDWDFPTFEEPLEIQVPTKVLGTFSEKLQVTFVARLLRLIPQPKCSCWTRLCQYLPSPDFWQVSIHGKWLQYGPLCVVMFIDLCYSRTQLVYDPSYFGQYVDPHDDFVWSITDQATLSAAYEGGYLKENGAELISFFARWNETTGEPLLPAALDDVKLNSRYLGSSIKYLALWISVVAIGSFACCLTAADWRRARMIKQIKQEEEEADAAERQLKAAQDSEAPFQASEPALPSQESSPVILAAEV